MKTKKRALATVIIFIVFFLLFAMWYKYEYSMDKVSPYEINSPDLNSKFVIATQGSEFKDEVTKEVINYYKGDSIYIKVIDISMLPEIEPANYKVILLIHTWENWKPPIQIETFINRTKEFRGKVIVLTTSGKGTFKMKDVDAITGESKLENAKPISKQVIEKLEQVFKNK